MNATILFNNPIIEKYNELMDEVANNETIQQILYTIATIAGVIVGVTVWVANRVSDWYNNGGRETLLKYTKQFLLFLSVSTEKLYYWVCDVTLSELSTNTPKRAWVMPYWHQFKQTQCFVHVWLTQSRTCFVFRIANPRLSILSSIAILNSNSSRWWRVGNRINPHCLTPTVSTFCDVWPRFCHS